MLGEQNTSQPESNTNNNQADVTFLGKDPLFYKNHLFQSNLCWKADPGSILLYVFKYLHPGHLPLQLEGRDVLIYTSAYTRAHTQSSYFRQITLPPTSKTG